MISAFCAWLGKRLSPVIILLLSTALFYGSVFTLGKIIRDAVATAEKSRDAHWQGEIDRANLTAARNIIEQMRASRAADLAAQAEITRLNTQLSELEAKNEGLPDRDGSGIDRARARLLNNEPLADNPH